MVRIQRNEFVFDFWKAFKKMIVSLLCVNQAFTEWFLGGPVTTLVSCVWRWSSYFSDLWVMLQANLFRTTVFLEAWSSLRDLFGPFRPLAQALAKTSKIMTIYKICLLLVSNWVRPSCSSTACPDSRDRDWPSDLWRQRPRRRSSIILERSLT